MIKAILVVLEPARTWERVALAGRSVAAILLTFVLPWLLLTSVVEAWGMMHWGDWRGDVTAIKKFTLTEAVGFQLAQWVVHLTTLFLGAKLLKSLGETFHGRHTFEQAFTAVAYGLGPFWALRLLDAFPAVNPWVSYSLEMVLMLTVFYQGIPRIMLPDPPQAFGLYLMGSVLLALAAGLGRFVIWWLQQGRFQGLEDLLTRVVSVVLPG